MTLYSDARPQVRPAFPNARRGRYDHYRARHRHGRVEPRHAEAVREVEIVGLSEQSVRDRPTGIEMFRKLLTSLRPATTSALWLRAYSATRSSAASFGQARSISPTPSQPSVYVLTKEEGGRHTPYEQLSSAVLHRHHDVTAHHPAEGTEMCMPGDHATLKRRADLPLAIEEVSDSPSARRSTVGSGVVVSVIGNQRKRASFKAFFYPSIADIICQIPVFTASR